MVLDIKVNAIYRLIRTLRPRGMDMVQVTVQSLTIKGGQQEITFRQATIQICMVCRVSIPMRMAEAKAVHISRGEGIHDYLNEAVIVILMV